MIDYEEKRSETRHRMGFMTPLLVFVLAFVACCGVIACVFLRAAVISDEAARESAGIALCRSAAEEFRVGEIPENGEKAYFTKDMASCAEADAYYYIETEVTAAETGQLLLSSLHTTGAANTIDRIIDAFPPNQQAQIRLQLSMVLQAVISQQLVPGVDGTPIPVFEIMYSTLAIRNMIRESKTHQLDAAIASGAAQGMRTMDMALADLVRQKRITEETALYYCTNYETMQKRLQLL